jgi:hypothetical protein
LKDIDTWLREFLTEFRRQSEKLSEDERAKIYKFDDFSSPCQILLLWFKDANAQFLIVTHDEDREDQEITVHGPVPTYEAVETLDSILKDPKWNIELSEEEKKLLPETIQFNPLEYLFFYIVNQLRELQFTKPVKAFICSKSVLSDNSFTWQVQGNIAELNHVELVNEIIEEARKEAEVARTKKEPSAPSPPTITIKGCGIYFHPPIWIGKLPRKTFKQKMLGPLVFPMKAMDLKYKGKIVVIKEDGFIAIGEENTSKATRMLNEIMATSLLLNFPALAVRELEVNETQIDPLTLDIRGGIMAMNSLRTQLAFSLWRPQLGVQPIEVRKEITKEELANIIQQAERITQDSEVADFLVFLLDAHTYLQNSEYMQSFIMSWMIIERHIFWLWKKFLKEEQINRKRRDKLTNSLYWTIDYVLETLNITGQINLEDYKNLMKLKKKRNDIIHKGEKVTLDEAERCFQIAMNIVKERSHLT